MGFLRPDCVAKSCGVRRRAFPSGAESRGVVSLSFRSWSISRVLVAAPPPEPLRPRVSTINLPEAAPYATKTSMLRKAIPHLYLLLHPHSPGAENPTYLKEPTDKVLFGVGVGGTFLGLVAVTSGLYSMSYGINKTP